MLFYHFLNEGAPFTRRRRGLSRSQWRTKAAKAHAPSALSSSTCTPVDSTWPANTIASKHKTSTTCSPCGCWPTCWRWATKGWVAHSHATLSPRSRRAMCARRTSWRSSTNATRYVPHASASWTSIGKRWRARRAACSACPSPASPCSSTERRGNWTSSPSSRSSTSGCNTTTPHERTRSASQL